MKNNLMKYATLAAMTAGMALAQQAPANPPQHPTAPAHRRFAEKRQQMMQKLNLTDAQKEQAKAIFQETRKNTEPVRAELRENRKAMAEAVKADNTAQIQKLSKTEGELMGRMMAARNEARAKFFHLLTPEQKAKAEQLHTAFRHRLEQRRAARNNG